MATSSTLIRPNISFSANDTSFDWQKVTCETRRTLSVSLSGASRIFSPQCTRNSSWPSVRPSVRPSGRNIYAAAPYAGIFPLSDSACPAVNIIFGSIPSQSEPGRGSTEKLGEHAAGSLQETGIPSSSESESMYAAFASSRSDVRRMGEKRQTGGGRRATGE